MWGTKVSQWGKHAPNFCRGERLLRPVTVDGLLKRATASPWRCWCNNYANHLYLLKNAPCYITGTLIVEAATWYFICISFPEVLLCTIIFNGGGVSFNQATLKRWLPEHPTKWFMKPNNCPITVSNTHPGRILTSSASTGKTKTWFFFGKLNKEKNILTCHYLLSHHRVSTYLRGFSYKTLRGPWRNLFEP